MNFIDIFLLYYSIKTRNSEFEPLLVGLQISKSRDDLDLKTVPLPGDTPKLVNRGLKSPPGSFLLIAASVTLLSVK